MNHNQRSPLDELRARRMEKFDIRSTTKAIGSPHDPYQQETLVVVNKETQWSFVRVQDGLGRSRLTIFAPCPVRHRGSEVHFMVEWFDNATSDAERTAQRTYEANLAATCTDKVGIAPDEAQAWFDETWEPDPMSEAYKGWR